MFDKVLYAFAVSVRVGLNFTFIIIIKYMKRMGFNSNL